MRLRSEGALLLLGRLLFDVFDDVADGLQFFGVLIGHFHGKFLFKGHYQLDDVERIRSQIIHEGRRGRHFRFVDAELFHRLIAAWLSEPYHG